MTVDEHQMMIPNDGIDFEPAQITPGTYRLDSLEVEAVRWDGTVEGAGSIINWVLAISDRAARYLDGHGPVQIERPSIAVDISAFSCIFVTGGDWLIHTSGGKFLTCTDLVFRAGYEQVEEKSEEDGIVAAQELADELNATGVFMFHRREKDVRDVVAEIFPTGAEEVVVSEKTKMYEVDDINWIFSFHPADTSERRGDHEKVRVLCRTVAHELNNVVPDGNEKRQMMDRLEEAMFWANAGVARFSWR